MLTDSDADFLIKLLKAVASRHNQTLTDRSSGDIQIVGKNDRRFILNYFYSESNKVFHLRETEHNYTLIRINLNNKFHKNANGEKIWGNRINVFSETEYYDKADETTHCKAYPLPHNSISNSNDFLKVLRELLNYTNTGQTDKININIQTGLL